MIAIVAFRLSSYDAEGLSEDPTFREAQFITWTSAELHYPLVAATVPILRPFMSNLSTNYGVGQGHEGSVYGPGSTNSHSHSVTRRLDKHATTQGFEMNSMTRKSARHSQRVWSRPEGVQCDARISSPPGLKSNAIKDTDAGSTGSNESQKMIIRKDITWQVDRDDNNS